MSVTREAAETLALESLAWLTANDDLLPVFLGASGAGAEDLRAQATSPEFLASLLDFVMMDDAWVVDCAASCGWPPTRMAEARAALPGGDLPNWT